MRLPALLASLLLITAGFIIAITILPGVARAATLYVGGSGPGNYTSIGAAITAASAGDTVFVYSGTYAETLTLGKTISLVGESRDATIVDGGSLYLSAQWANVSGFTFRRRGGLWGIRAHFSTDCRIEGNAISGYTYGILFNSSTRVTLANNAFTGTGVYINGMYGGSPLVEHWASHTIGPSNTVNGKPIVYWRDAVGGAIPAGAGQVLLANVSGVTVQSQSLTNASVGVEAGFSTDVRVLGNTISGNVADGIRLHHSTSSWIEANDVTANGEGIAVWVSDNNSLVNNTVTGNSIGGITVTASRDVIVTGNVLSSNIGAGVLIESSGGGSLLADNRITGSTRGIQSYGDSVSIINNTVYGNANGIDVAGATPTVILNTVFGNTGRGIMVELPGNAVIANNNLTGNGQGIQLYQTTNNTVWGNTVSRNRDGIFSGSGTSFNTIGNNTVTQNDYGITLYLSTGDTIVQNNVSGNRLGGVTIGSSSLAVVRDNVVAANAFSGTYGGIYLESATGIHVFHNTILGNARQARDDGTNSWDNGYPSGGNDWSDYTGIDNCSGPNQNTCPSPDGIGDTPYLFLVNARDRYPLMTSPVSQPTPPLAPLNVRAARGNQFVTLTWSAPVDDGGATVTNYRVYRGTTSGAEAFLIEVGDVRTYTDSGLTNGVTYYYQVSAKNAVGEGPRASEVSVTPATVPGPPTGLAATAGIQRITLTWTAPADDGGSVVTSYRIWRATTAGGEVFLTSVGGALTYLDAGVSSGTTYYYQVSAVNSVGESVRSGEAHATPTSPANQPPTCSVATPALGDRVSGTYPVTGTADDPDGSVVRVEVRIDGGAWSNATGTSSWRYNWDSRAVPDGPHTIHARGYDGMSYSSVVDVNVTVDNGAPPRSVVTEGRFWALIGLVVLVSTTLLFVLWRGRRKPPPIV